MAVQDRHRPEFAEFVQRYTSGGLDRMEFRVPSATKAGAFHNFHVCTDGTRPNCDCFAYKVRKACYLTEHATEVLREHYRRQFRAMSFPQLEAKDREMLETAGRSVWGEAGRIEYLALGDAIGERLGAKP